MGRVRPGSGLGAGLAAQVSLEKDVTDVHIVKKQFIFNISKFRVFLFCYYSKILIYNFSAATLYLTLTLTLTPIFS